MECYTEEGLTYQGTETYSEDNQLCDRWSYSSDDRYCKNMKGYSMPKPWCYVNGAKKACAVDKCERDCGDPTSGMWGRFQAKQTGMCWDIVGKGTNVRNNGANLQMNTCELPQSADSDHVWKMENGFIINQHSDKCVNLEGDSDTGNKVNYNLWTCQFFASETDQRFSLDWHPTDSCAFRLRNRATNKCIDADGKNDDDIETNVIQYSCKDSDSDDHWYYFIPVEDRVCNYEFKNHTQMSGDSADSVKYNTLFAAQAACSRLGGKCGGIYYDPPYAKKYYLRQGTGTWNQNNYQAWVKKDCEDEKFDYFEQKFKD